MSRRRETGRDLNVDWSKDIALRKILELGGIKVIEHRWSGNYKDISSAQRGLDDTMNKALKMAGERHKIMTIMYSAGNWVGERFGASDLNPIGGLSQGN
mgnify:CR=1 FL=1